MKENLDISNLSIIPLHEEVWRDVVGREGFYIVSNLGRIYSLPRKSLSKTQDRFLKGLMIKVTPNFYGYPTVYLYGSDLKYINKSFHRIVAESFIGMPINDTMEVNHINGIRNDCRAVNLEWVTHSENVLHSYKYLRGIITERVIKYENIKISALENEFFVFIDGFNEDYKISNLGRVVSLKNKDEKLLSITINDKGYPIVFLSKNNSTKHFSIHRLVAIAFIPNPDNKPQVNHKNGIRTDFSIPNLEWNTASENVVHSYKVLGKIHNTTGMFNRCGKKVAQYDLDGNLLNIFESTMDAERKLKISNTNISFACKSSSNRSFSGFLFKYFIDSPLEKIDKYVKTPNHLSTKIEIISLKDNVIMEFNTIQEGASKININKSTLSKYLKNKKEYNGYFFKIKN